MIVYHFQILIVVCMFSAIRRGGVPDQPTGRAQDVLVESLRDLQDLHSSHNRQASGPYAAGWSHGGLGSTGAFRYDLAEYVHHTKRCQEREGSHCSILSCYITSLIDALINGQPNLTRNNATESFCGSAGDISHHLMGGPRDAPVLYLLQRVAQWLLSLGGRPVRQVRVDVCHTVTDNKTMPYTEYDFF